MPLELAIRPRIRLREDFMSRKRRRRFRLPEFALPVMAYWAAIGLVWYAVLHLPHPDPILTSPEAAAAPAVADTLRPLSHLTETPIPPEPPPATAVADAPTLPTPRRSMPLELAPVATVASPVARALDELRTGAAPLATSPPAAAAASTAPAPARTRDERHDRENSDSVVGGAAAGRSLGLPSCEAASAAAVQDLDFSSSDRTADLPSAVIAAVLENGSWLASCNVPVRTRLGVCVAIRRGQVTAVTVKAEPADRALEVCIGKRAAALVFPYSTRLDIARTQF